MSQRRVRFRQKPKGGIRSAIQWWSARKELERKKNIFLDESELLSLELS
jgi:hypothetical protein